MTSRTFIGRGGGRGRVPAPAAVDESAEGKGGGDAGEGRVGGQGQAGRPVGRGWRCGERTGERAWARAGERDRRSASRARGRSQDGRSGRLGVAQQRERVDVAATVAGASGTE